MENKRALRIKAKSIRKNLNIAQISNEICNIIQNSDFYKKAENILIFYPTENEIDLRKLLKDNKKFFLPKVNDSEMLICPYAIGEKLEISPLNIKEPCSNPVYPDILDIVFVPALMADKEFNRLGYGGGFYDRFLAEHNIYSIAVIADELVVDKLPQESFDKKVDLIITEKKDCM